MTKDYGEVIVVVAGMQELELKSEQEKRRRKQEDDDDKEEEGMEKKKKRSPRSDDLQGATTEHKEALDWPVVVGRMANKRR